MTQSELTTLIANKAVGILRSSDDPYMIFGEAASRAKNEIRKEFESNSFALIIFESLDYDCRVQILRKMNKRIKELANNAANDIADQFSPGFFDDRMVNDVADSQFCGE